MDPWGFGPGAAQQLHNGMPVRAVGNRPANHGRWGAPMHRNGPAMVAGPGIMGGAGMMGAPGMMGIGMDPRMMARAQMMREARMRGHLPPGMQPGWQPGAMPRGGPMMGGGGPVQFPPGMDPRVQAMHQQRMNQLAARMQGLGMSGRGAMPHNQINPRDGRHPGQNFDPSRMRVRAPTPGRQPQDFGNSSGRSRSRSRGRSHGDRSQSRGRRYFESSRGPSRSRSRGRSVLQQSPSRSRSRSRRSSCHVGFSPGAPDMREFGSRSPPGRIAGRQDKYGSIRGARVRGKGIPIDGYEKVKTLARGGMSKELMVVRELKSGKLWVEKRISVEDGDRTYSTREYMALKCVKDMYGPNGHLSYMHEFRMDRNSLIASVIIDYCDLGSLDGFLEKAVKDQVGHVGETYIWNVLQGVAKGLAFLHDGIKTIQPGHKIDKPSTNWNTIVHLDIKPQNILLASSAAPCGGMPRVVLADFGCAVTANHIKRGKEQDRQQPCGTAEWYPPEGDISLGPQGSYGTKTDMWQLGVTVHLLCTPTPPLNRQRVLSSLAGREPLRGYGRRLNSIVKDITRPDFKERAPARDVAAFATKVFYEKLQNRD